MIPILYNVYSIICPLDFDMDIRVACFLFHSMVIQVLVGMIGKRMMNMNKCMDAGKLPTLKL
ncbi:hypothetical protein, partial [Pseudomonas syringae]|uniref:hypothetical protein n=1 Tax=Pseudomonas syringae TaxID=317 RepID=UPI0034D59F2D